MRSVSRPMVGIRRIVRWPHKHCRDCGCVLPRMLRRMWCAECHPKMIARGKIRDRARRALRNSRKHAEVPGYMPLNMSRDDLAYWMTNTKEECAICGALPKSHRHLEIDHDHATGELRGYLCTRCNTRIGIFEDLDFANKAMRYLYSSSASSTSLSSTGKATQRQFTGSDGLPSPGAPPAE